MKHSCIRCAPSALALFVVLTQAASAQQPASIPRPAPAPAPTFHFPHVDVNTLPNGLRVLIVEDHAVPVVAVRTVLAVDETFDPAGKPGVYAVTVSSLREGTTLHTSAELADASARIGTAVAPTAFTTTTTSFDAALALMGEMWMHPSFDQTAIDRRKAAQASTFRNRSQSPSQPARNLFYSIVDGRDDPFTISQYVAEGDAARITRDDVTAFYNQYIGPQTTTVIISGDITKAKALAAATNVFGGWKKGSGTAVRSTMNPPPSRPTTIYLLDVPNGAAYAYVGNGGPQRAVPDAFAADLAGAISNLRFTQTLRDKRSFMYSGASGFVWRPVPRSAEFLGSTTVAATKIDSALIEWVGMLRGLRGGVPVTAAELDNARNLKVGALWTKTDGPDSVATRIAEAVRDNLPPDFLERYVAGVNAVTPQAAAAAAAKYIDADHLSIIVTGDRKVLEPALRAANIAPIVIVDANGKPLPSPTP